jgi:hypothetical protein
MCTLGHSWIYVTAEIIWSSLGDFSRLPRMSSQSRKGENVCKGTRRKSRRKIVSSMLLPGFFSDSLTVKDAIKSPGNAGHSPYVRPHPHRFSHAQVLSDPFPVSAPCVIIHARGLNNANSSGTTDPSARPRPHLDGASGLQASGSVHTTTTAVFGHTEPVIFSRLQRFPK